LIADDRGGQQDGAHAEVDPRPARVDDALRELLHHRQQAGEPQDVGAGRPTST
jgi:hypothetical protein